MLVNVGEKLHVLTRRLFESDVRRHFAGEVKAAESLAVRLEGYLFVFDAAKNAWVKRPEKRTRIVGLADSGHVVKVIPSGVNLDELEYRISPDKHLVVTDGRGFSLDINEFGAHR